MEEHKLQFHSIVKEEPCEFCNATKINTSEMHLNLEETYSLFSHPSSMDQSTTVKIEEMNLNDIKIEENLGEQGISLNKQEEAHQVQYLAPDMQKRKNKKILNPKKLMKIATAYADLYSDEVCRATPFPRFRGSTIIQCPACILPRDRWPRSAFLELLQHVKRRHPESSALLITEISERYASLIECMKRKIFNGKRKTYSKRLRNKK